MAVPPSAVAPSHSSRQHHRPNSNHAPSYPPRRNTSTSNLRKPARPAIKKINSSTKVKKVSIDDSPVFQDDDDMAASFLNFCTVCENQIITPSSVILYCSESCRRRDTNKPLSPDLSTSYTSPPTTPDPNRYMTDHEFPPTHDIVPQRSPTAVTLNRSLFMSLSSAASSDTEMDPSEPESRGDRHWRRQESEAARYLRQFQSPSFQAESARSSARRPKPISRTSTASLAPSLTHSPSPGTSPNTPLPSLPYSRPLPSRTNPYSSSYGSKSINLVMPLTGSQLVHGAKSVPRAESRSTLPGFKSQPSVSTDVGADELPNGPENGLTYEKKTMELTFKDEKSHLRTLFAFNKMQAPPAK